MDSSPVLVKHECNVSIRHDIMRGFRHTNLRGFYFQVVVRERTMHYYFSGSDNDLVHHYSVDGVRNGCWKFVVEAEEIFGCEDTAIIAITTMLRSINICETVRPEMVRKIYSTVNSLARQVEHVGDGRIPVMVDIVRVFRQAAPNPNPSLIQDGQQWDGNRDDEDEDEDGNGDDEDEYEYEYEDEDEDEPVPAAWSSVAALEKVKLKPKGTCTICLGGLIKATRMPCSHLFHHHCIVRWLKTNNACPLCRFQLPAAN